ncbi:hypothetical protein NFI95_08515 [Acetobacteraceae bacterium KSS8]|uniref:PepSY domain-containing protein n=1 Tax=Endosaccharibacter trunci TaxID=2812733 RepID=A0ABT1W6J5_9PROT|nr:hypothetical protein [Acetobacteraceae bacterium KSS8]
MMLRRLHAYLSIACAPIILFFCLSGALQLFDWHTPRDGYRPPVLVQQIAMLHKKQRFAVPQARRPAPPGPGKEERPRPAPAFRTVLLRWLFLFATLALTASTLLGLWMGLTHVKRRRLGWILLAGGTILPVLIVAL